MRIVTSLVAAVLVMSMVITAAFARDGASPARREVQAAIAAMGGRPVLNSVHSLKFAAVGHRNMLEQSLRPDGPWWQDYFQLDEIRDFDTRSERVSGQHRGYSSSEWWLQHSGWDSAPYYPDYVVADGVVASVVNGKYSRSSSDALQTAEEDFAFGPLGLLQTALAAPDLHAEPDVMLHGFRHHVVAFTWKGYPVRLYLNGYTGLPAILQWTRPQPYDVFWNVWGDVTTRITYGMWSLEPDGLHYPRQWTIERNGLPDSDITITSLSINPAFNPDALKIPEDVRKDFLAHQYTVDEVPLGVGGGPPVEMEPGLIHLPGAWNVNLARQPDGVVVLEGPISSSYSIKVLDEAHRRFPNLPVKAVITTSDSWPHIGGLREYVERGIPIYALDLDQPILERLFTAAHTYRPDHLQKHPRAPVWRLIHARTVLGSGPNRMELIPYRTQTGERQTMVYFPEYRLLYTSDLFAPDQGDTWFTPEYLLEVRQAVAREHLVVDNIFGMHYDLISWQTVMTALDAFLSPKIAATTKDPAALKPAIQSLAFFEGHWTCNGKFPNGKAISAAETFSVDLGSNWLVMRHDDNPPFSWHSLAVWGYDAKNKQFSYYNFDNFANAHHYTSSGWSGNKLTWTLSHASPPVAHPDRFTFERRGDLEYQVTYSVSKDGINWVDGDSSACRRS